MTNVEVVQRAPPAPGKAGTRMPLRAPRGTGPYLTALACAAVVPVFLLAPAALAVLRTDSVLLWSLVAGVVISAVVAGYARGLGGRVATMGGVGLVGPLAFALLLVAGTPAAALVVAWGSAVGAARSRTVRSAVVDATVPVLSILAAGATAELTAGNAAILAFDVSGWAAAVAIAGSGAVLFVCNVGLRAIATALIAGAGVRAHITREIAAHRSTGLVLLSVAPVALVVATTTPALLPLVALPIVAIYRSAQAVQAKEHLALHDVLTGLPNRRLFLDRLHAALADVEQTGAAAAVLLIDLDRFKEVNDRLGHHVGDLLLQAVGPALIEQVTPGGTVARMGGDEFAMCLPDVDGADEAVRVAKGIVARLTRPFIIEGCTVDIGASIGIALSPTHGEDLSTIMQRADTAMYLAKESRGGFEVYSEARDPQRRQRITSPADLRRATEEGELVLHFQPKVDLSTGRARGVEALVRWNHPALGLVGPREFIPLAERAGLMGPLTTFVLARSLEQCAHWRGAGMDLRLAVNLSVQSLYDDAFPGLVAGLLQRSEVAASQLVLDVTESTVMADPRRAQSVLAELAALGVTLAIDDFGTGYSSLAYLKQLPVSELKIDTSFVLGMATDSNDAVIVHSTIDLGQKFGLEVVAEGVESQRVWRLLERLGCDLAQGSYICPPLSAADLTPWLRANAQDAARREHAHNHRG